MSLIDPSLPDTVSPVVKWGRLYGAAAALAIAEAAARSAGPLVVVAHNSRDAETLSDEDRILRRRSAAGAGVSRPGDPSLRRFSAHPDITSARLPTLAELPRARKGVWLVAVDTLLQRLAPRSYVEAHSLKIHVGETLDLDELRTRLTLSGYAAVTQVVAHGEFAVRGSLLDVFPMGSDAPYRIDLLDREVDSIRHFDPDTQRSGDKLERIHLLPARETPLNPGRRARIPPPLPAALLRRSRRTGDLPRRERRQRARRHRVLPAAVLRAHLASVRVSAAGQHAGRRQRGDRRAPTDCGTTSSSGTNNCATTVTAPFSIRPRLYLRAGRAARASLPPGRSVDLRTFEWPPETAGTGSRISRAAAPAGVRIDSRAEQPAAELAAHLAETPARVLLAAESAGRRELLLDLLRGRGHAAEGLRHLRRLPGRATQRLGITVSPAVSGLRLDSPPLEILTEAQLFGDRARQERRRRRAERDPAKILKELSDLRIGAPVVHETYGVGRYVGLQTMDVAGYTGEFLVLEYADGDKLYVPVQALHLVSRYTGAPAETRAAAQARRRPMAEGAAQGGAAHPRRRRGAARPVLAARGPRGRADERRARPNTAPSRRPSASRRPPIRQRRSTRCSADLKSAQADGPRHLRRCRLRQDRGGAARRLRRRAGGQAGGGARPDHAARAAALHHVHRPIRRLAGAGREPVALPDQQGGRRRSCDGRRGGLRRHRDRHAAAAAGQGAFQGSRAWW